MSPSRAVGGGRKRGERERREESVHVCTVWVEKEVGRFVGMKGGREGGRETVTE